MIDVERVIVIVADCRYQMLLFTARNGSVRIVMRLVLLLLQAGHLGGQMGGEYLRSREECGRRLIVVIVLLLLVIVVVGVEVPRRVVIIVG